MSQLPNLHPDTVNRLIKLCALLGADAHHGERAAAALKATELLTKHGVTWADLIQAATRPSPYAAYQKRPQRRRRRQDVARLLERPDMFTAWERNFLEGIAMRARLTPKQQSRLDEILRKAGGGT